jgi:hypothetical protein
MRQQVNEGPGRQTAANLRKEPTTTNGIQKVELRTAITSEKQRNDQEDPMRFSEGRRQSK